MLGGEPDPGEHPVPEGDQGAQGVHPPHAQENWILNTKSHQNGGCRVFLNKCEEMNS